MTLTHSSFKCNGMHDILDRESYIFYSIDINIFLFFVWLELENETYFKYKQ